VCERENQVAESPKTGEAGGEVSEPKRTSKRVKAVANLPAGSFTSAGARMPARKIFTPGREVSLRLKDLLPKLSAKTLKRQYKTLESQPKSGNKPEDITVGPFEVKRVSKDEKKVYVKRLAPFPSKEIKNKKKEKSFAVQFVTLYNKEKEPRGKRHPSHLTVKGEKRWIVEAILDRNKQNRYLVKWQDFSYHDSTWEPAKCFPENLIKNVWV